MRVVRPTARRGDPDDAIAAFRLHPTQVHESSISATCCPAIDARTTCSASGILQTIQMLQRTIIATLAYRGDGWLHGTTWARKYGAAGTAVRRHRSGPPRPAFACQWKRDPSGGHSVALAHSVGLRQPRLTVGTVFGDGNLRNHAISERTDGGRPWPRAWAALRFMPLESRTSPPRGAGVMASLLMDDAESCARCYLRRCIPPDHQMYGTPYAAARRALAREFRWMATGDTLSRWAPSVYRRDSHLCQIRIDAAGARQCCRLLTPEQSAR